MYLSLTIYYTHLRIMPIVYQELWILVQVGLLVTERYPSQVYEHPLTDV